MKTAEEKPRQTRRRSKGSGSITQKPSGIYCFQFRGADGKKVTKSLGTRNYKVATEKAIPLAEAFAAKDTAEAVQKIAKAKDLIDTKTLALDGVWEAFVATRPSAGTGTQSLYKNALNRFVTWAKANRPSLRELADVDARAASDWLQEEWEGGISASTYNDRRGSMLTITKALMRPYRLSENPWIGTDRKKMAGKQQIRLPLNKDQVEALLNMDIEQDTRVLMLLALCAGMRLKDAVLLEWESISGGFITYTPAKTINTSSARVQVPILPILLEALKALPRTKEEKFILPRLAEWYQSNSSCVNRMLLRKIHSVTGSDKQDASGKGKVARSEYGYHSLRHTFCTECARAGVPATMLAAMAGDTIATLDKFYVKLDLAASAIPQLSKIRTTLALAVGGEGAQEREQLKQLIDELPLSKVRELIKQLS
jgi:integrase